MEVARRLHRAFNERDRDALAEVFDPDVEWIPILAKLEGASFRGPEGVNRWLGVHAPATAAWCSMRSRAPGWPKYETAGSFARRRLPSEPKPSKP